MSEAVGKKAIKGRVRHDLVPVYALNEIAKVFTYGAEKYDDDNWRNGLEYRRTMGALKRHIANFEAGNFEDEESGLLHLAHAGCQVMMMIELQMRGNLFHLPPKIPGFSTSYTPSCSVDGMKEE